MAIETRLIWKGSQKKEQMENAIYKALIRATNKVQSDAKLLVRKDTTNLEKSIVKTVDKKDLTGTVLTNSEYAFAQEFGLRSTEKYGFTPYMRPALSDNKAKINYMFRDEGRKAVDN